MQVHANVYFQYTPALNSAQELITQLKLNKAEQAIRADKFKNPNNIAADYLLSYVNYYRVLTSQSQQHFDNFKTNCNYTIKRIEELPQKNEYKKYLLAEIAIQQAFSKVLFNEYLSSAWQLRQAYSLLDQNQKENPMFFANKKNLGFMQALVGTLPDNYKWIVNAVGLKGTFTEGMQLLKNYCDNAEQKNEPDIEVEEAKIIYTLLLTQFADDKTKAFQYCTQNFNNTKNSLSHVFINAYVGNEAKKPVTAINAIYNLNRQADYTEFYFIDYLLAKAKLFTQAPDADLWFKKYVTFYKGNFLVKDSYKKLSWIYLLDNDTNQYLVYRNLSLKGNKELNEEDYNTQKLIAKKLLPNAKILEARILFDGGFFEKAIDILQSIDPTKITDQFELTEYYYRLSRVYFEHNKTNEAIICYKLTIKYGKPINSYMAPYAEYYLGKIYLAQQNSKLAQTHLNKALNYSNYSYESSLKQKVKAALNN